MSNLQTIGKPISTGHHGRVHEFGGDDVIKIFPHAMPEEDILREMNAALFAHKMGIPTPLPKGVYKVGDNQLGLVFERVSGKSLSQYVLERPWRLFWAATKFAESHQNINSLSYPNGLSIKTELANRIKSVTEIVSSEIYVVLEQLADLEDGNYLCHYDLHAGNVMTDGRTLHVIDWGGAARGPMVADIAHTYVLNKVDGFPEETNSFIKILIKILRGVYLEAYVFAYARNSRMYNYRALRGELRRWLKIIATARLASYGDYENPALLSLIRKN